MNANSTYLHHACLFLHLVLLLVLLTVFEPDGMSMYSVMSVVDTLVQFFNSILFFFKQISPLMCLDSLVMGSSLLA